MCILVTCFEAAEEGIAKLQDQLNTEFSPQVTIIAHRLPVFGDDKILWGKHPSQHDAKWAWHPSSQSNVTCIWKWLPRVCEDINEHREQQHKATEKERQSQNYKKVFLQSSKSHIKRLMELNIVKLLEEILYGMDKYRLTANGWLVKKDDRGEQYHV